MGNQKIKNSGYPKEVITHEQKVQYCQEVNEAMNFTEPTLKLTPENVTFNSVQRSVTKEGLNSILGKMSQDANLTKKLFLDSSDEFERILNEASDEISEIMPINQNIVQVQTKKRQGYEQISLKTNVVK